MNREIKFRGKSKKTGEWVYGDLSKPADFLMGEDPCVFPIDAYDSFDNYIVAKNTVGQYTGLKDKNGVEIYEGDIIMSSASTGEPIYYDIFYNEDQAAFCAGLDGERFSLFGVRKQWIDAFGKEVVGNIHDNPELLNKEETK